MRASKRERHDIREIARSLGVDEDEAWKAVLSFFGAMKDYARSLPLDNPGRIYLRDGFEKFGKVWHIPGIGRIGPVYSRYLRWRANEAASITQKGRRGYMKELSEKEIDSMAKDILSGKAPSTLQKRIKGMYNNVWLVGKEGKKLAWQVIPKTKENDGI